MRAKKLLKTVFLLIGLGLVFGLCLAYYGIQIEPSRFQIKKITIQTSNIGAEQSGLRVAILSDIHLGSRFNNLARLKNIIQKINAQNPDIVLLPGDFINGRGEWGTNYETFTEQDFVRALTQIKTPRIASFGNHEYIRRRQMKPNKLKELFEKNGIKLLHNEAQRIETRLGSLWVAGLDDASKGKPDYEKTMTRIPENSTILYMSHNPDGFEMLTKSVALAVAGDTHCGQINFFGFRPAIYASGHIDTFKKWSCGLYKNLPLNNIGLVSSGIGTSNFPIRIGALPQAEIITLEYKSP